MRVFSHIPQSTMKWCFAPKALSSAIMCPTSYSLDQVANATNKPQAWTQEALVMLPVIFNPFEGYV